MIDEVDIRESNSLFTKEELQDFDIERTFYNVSLYMKKYRLLRCNNYNLPQINLSSKLKMIFVQESTRSVNQYTKLDKYIDDESEYLEKSSIIAKISDMFTVEEYIYFTSCLFKCESERTAYQKIGCSSTGLVPIKNSCIVKVGIGLKIAVTQGEKLDAENEELFKNFIS